MQFRLNPNHAHAAVDILCATFVGGTLVWSVTSGYRGGTVLKHVTQATAAATLFRTGAKAAIGLVAPPTLQS